MDELTSLARAAGRGDRAALTGLVRQTQGDIWRLCAHLVDPASADDLAQETYVRAIPALRKFRGDAPARIWLLTIARRTCAAELVSRAKDRRLAARLVIAPEAAMGQQPPGPDTRALAASLLACLDPDRRAAFVLTQMLGCSYAEAAQICGCPVGTIRSRVARAREDLDTTAAEHDSSQESTAARECGHSG